MSKKFYAAVAIMVATCAQVSLAAWDGSAKVPKVVEKDGQKGIVIGAGGKRIRSIGLKARRDIEKLLDKHVYLELFVKIEEDWRDKESSLKKFGYKKED